MATRTESLTIRIDPKIKYLAQVASAQRRISLSSLIDQALIEAIKATAITEMNVSTSVWNEAGELYSEFEADRMVKLAERFEFLLTPEQQSIWAHIQATQKYWLADLSQGLWSVTSATFNFKALRNDWDKLTAKYGKGGL